MPPSPREDAEFHADFFANEMRLLRKQFLDGHAEDLGKEFDLFAGRRTAERFDVGQNFARHVDATDQMQFGDEIVLRPATLIAQIRDLSSDDICVSHPLSEGFSNSLRQIGVPIKWDTPGKKIMSYFSTALKRIAERNDFKQADIVRESGLTRSHVSRLFTGDQKLVYDADMAAILRVFRRNPRDQAELVAARCMDVRTGPGAELVEITIKSEGQAQRSGREREIQDVELSHETERAFAWLRSQCPINADLEKHLVGYARLTGMK